MAADKSKDGTMTTSQAGKKGGDKVRDERGPEFYSEIGKKQGKDNNPGNFANRPKEDVEAAGRKGGESRGRQRDAGEQSLDEAADQPMDEAA